MEILEEYLGSNDHSIVKGKRTKRQRTSTSTLSSSGATTAPIGGDGGGGEGSEFHSFLSSPTTSISTNTEEDEDMANCLILLAQGGVSLPKNVTSAMKESTYIYECKTCNRSFPSFQALGGHRASHKRSKPSENDRNETPVHTGSGDQEEEEEEEKSHKSFHVYTQNKPKIHECSICGTEFSSGQALGGHMRRHRNPNSTRVIESSISNDGEKPRSILALDLNLPAPAEDDPRSGSESKFQFSSNHQGLVFSAVALVDCHY